METEQELTTRFFTKVEKAPSGCWEWIAGKNAYGYGQFKYPTGSDNSMGAHKASYLYFYGSIPEGKQVNHHCDNRACVNPTHLYAGTHQDNMDDMVNRGRWNGGMPKKEFCLKGHRIADDAIVRAEGHRSCRKCNMARSKEFRAEKKRQLNKESNNV